MNFATLKTSIFALTASIALSACDEAAVQSADAPTATAPASTEQIPLASALQNSGNQKIIQAMDICLDNFPNMLTVRNSLRTSNFKSEIRYGGTEYFSAFNRDIIAFGSIGTNEPRCGFGRSGLRDEEAVLVAASILGAKFGNTLKEFDTSADPDWLAAYYIEKSDGTEVVVAVRRQIAIAGFYRGSLIYVSEFIEPEEE